MNNLFPFRDVLTITRLGVVYCFFESLEISHWYESLWSKGASSPATQLQTLGLATMFFDNHTYPGLEVPARIPVTIFSHKDGSAMEREHRSNLPFLYYLSDGLHDNGRFTALFPVSIVLLDVVWGSVTVYPARQSLWRWSWWQSQVFLLAWVG